MKVFWELTAIRFFITGIVIYALILFTQPFISCWFGKEYLLNDLIFYLLVFNIFINLSRGVVQMYIGALGLYSDIWAVWTELALNLIITLCTAPFIGIAGILLGKIVSVFFLATFWKPYFLFSKGLQEKVKIYWRGMIPFYAIFFVFLCITLYLRYYVIIIGVSTLKNLIGYVLLIYPILIVIFFLTLFTCTQGMKYFVARNPFLYHKLQIFV
jgi:hypothetical protein